ncbi:MAG TPA: hypothetical protein VIF12_04135 [Micavibrio sp.]|jgi:adenylate kinase family enzyme
MNGFGNRICIIGPSSSGKSTLAQALSVNLRIPCHHLDQIAHIAGTNWQRRCDDDLVYDHNQIIATENWIIDGNYSVCMPERLARATSVIWLDPSLTGCLFRYLKRCLRNNPRRPGRIDAAKKEFSLKLIRYTLVHYPRNRKKYKALLEFYPSASLFMIKSMRDLKKFYKSRGLSRASSPLSANEVDFSLKQVFSKYSRRRF